MNANPNYAATAAFIQTHCIKKEATAGTRPVTVSLKIIFFV